MNFNNHYKLKGLHAPFSASQSSWLNYSEDKLKEVYINRLAAARGTELHEWAAKSIELQRKQPKSKETIAHYINDAIGFRMQPEQILYYSENFFGTADAISFKKNFLRIHDLKTGKIPAHIEQLKVYAALFCLEYGIKPGDIQMELRIYQNDDVLICNPTAEDILPIMDKIISFDKIISGIKEEME